MGRIDKESYYLDIAETVLERSTCSRSHSGALIVRNDEIVSTGYNGAPRGRSNCIDLGYCIRERLGIPAGERYELCRSVHAEMNAIISDRLTRERSKYADYDDLKAKAAQFDAAQEAGKTELQKANEKAAKLQQQLDALNSANTLREVRAKVSAATGVPADLLSGDTEEACTAQAQAILKFAKPGYPNVRDGGDPHHTPTGSTRQQFADWFEQVTK